MTLLSMVRRNCKLFFKDKGTFFPALIAPIILLFLFVAFLGNVYKESLASVLGGAEIPASLTNGFTAGWLVSSLLAVSAVTIAFTANTIMVQDKALGRADDLFVSPVKKRTLALAYYFATVLVTLTVCGVALVAGLVYVAACVWYLSAADVLLAVLDTVLLVFFGTALSSIVCRFLKSQGGISAVVTIVSAAYGFLCGAYMPLSSMAKGLSSALMFLPGTYGTALLHEHLMGGAIDRIGALTSPEFALRAREGFDCTLSFFGSTVPEWTCYLVLCAAIALIVLVYVLLCALPLRRRKK